MLLVLTGSTVEYQDRGLDLLLTGQSPLGEILASPSAPSLNGIAVCLVDVADDERRRRLARRDGDQWSPEANRVVGNGGAGDDLRMRSAESELDAALLRLADVLAGVQADAGDYCGYCYTEQDSVALSGTVDAIPADLVRRVATEVPDHWGDFANLYKRLAARIMEQTIQGALYSEELVAERLVEAGCWSTWAEDERTAMLAVCNVWWEATLSSYPRRPEAREVLSFLAATPVPFVDWLRVWNAQPPGPADQHAADLCLWWAGELLGGELKVGWSDTIDITADVKRWILEDAPQRLARVPADPRLTEYLEFLAAD